MALHIFKTKNSFRNATKDFSKQLNSEDVLLFIEDAVYDTLNPSVQNITQQDSLPCKTYALEADLLARGIVEKKQDTVHAISYNDFVNLTESHKQIFTW